MTRYGTRPVRGAAGAWRIGGWVLALMLALVAGMPARGSAAEYTIAPAPAWVAPVSPGTPGPAQGGDDVAYLLSDTQVLAGDRQRVAYRRVASTALNASGVESIANIEIPFDPSYQTLVLHAINVVRHGRVIPKLATAKIHVIQREAGLETRIYDGTKTLNVFLDDVRVGDTIDYAYSRIGRNPVFDGRDFGAIALQYGTPVARIHARLLVAQGRQLALAERHVAAKAVMSEHDGLRDYVWDATDVAGLQVEEGAPAWYAPYAEVDWSEFPGWPAVVRWALPLYRVPADLGPALQAQVERIRRSESTPAGRMLAALRLVQGEVRYLGIEIGQNSHAPNPPATVFARRFGDCKDKTLLTLALLDRLGIEAHAALVNTRLRRGLADELPSAGAFDHVLVHARIGDRTWWLDPTRDTQQADLAHLFQPDYGLALVVDPHTRGLVAMTRDDHASPGSRSLRVVFDASAGFDKPMPFTVETTVRGGAAESLRATLASVRREDVQKHYLNFYATDYPHIAVAAPMVISDDKPGNLITTNETYTLADLPRPSADGKGKVADFYAPDMVQLLRDPAVTIRKAPLWLPYPVDLSQRTEVLLPSDWPVKPYDTTVADPAFRYEKTVRLEGRRLVITQHVVTLADEVPAADMSSYLANLARARAETGYELSWNPSPAAATPRASGLDRMNWPVALLALAMFGFSAWMAVVVNRYDPPPSADRGNRWVGIEGWLILLALALVFRPVVFVGSLVRLSHVMSIEKWARLTTFGAPSYHALWAPLLLFELAVNLAQLVASALLLVLFFRRRSNFPRVALATMFATIVLQVADLLLASLLPAIEVTSQDISRTTMATIGAVLWSCYLLQSERVKSTFVRRYRRDTPPPLRQAGPVAAVEPVATAGEGG